MDKAIETPVEGVSQLRRFMATNATLPDDVKARLETLAFDEPSPVTASVEAAELIYARADDLPKELLAIGAEIAAMAANFNFHGMRKDDRGYAIAKTLRERPGVTAPATAPSKLKVPEAAERHRKPEAPAVAASENAGGPTA